MEDKKINLKEAALYTNLSPKTIYNLVYYKKIPFKRISERKVVFDKDELGQWLLERKKGKKEYNPRCQSENVPESVQKPDRSSKNFFIKLNYRYLVYIVVLLLIFSLGWLGRTFYDKAKFSPSALSYDPAEKSAEESFDFKSLIEKAKIENMQIDQPYLGKGIVAITMDYISNVELSGGVNSPYIKTLLCHTLDNNEGGYAAKSRVIDVFKSHIYDKDIREALIDAMKGDKSPAIRLKAISVLAKIANFREVKKALIYVLINDGSEGIRFKALEILEKGIDKEIIDVLETIKGKEDSTLIKSRADMIYKKYNL